MKLRYILFLCFALPALAQKASITILAPQRGQEFVMKGTQLYIEYKTVNAPSTSSVGFFFYPNVPESESAGFPSGPTSLNTYPWNENPHGHATWSLPAVPCMKKDVPSLCNDILKPGRYRLEAYLYNKREATLIGPNAPTKADIIAEAISGEFVLLAEEKITSIQIKLREVALVKLEKLLPLKNFPGANYERFLASSSELKGPLDGMYCQKFFLAEPFSGEILSCFDEKTGKYKTGGKVTSREFFSPYEKAQERAYELVTKKYQSRVDFKQKPTTETIKDPEMLKQATYLGLETLKWSYSEQGKGQWTFMINAFKAGGAPNGSDRFNDVIIISISVRESWHCLRSESSFERGKDLDVHHNFKSCYQ